MTAGDGVLPLEVWGQKGFEMVYGLGPILVCPVLIVSLMWWFEVLASLTPKTKLCKKCSTTVSCAKFFESFCALAAMVMA